jgi:hypothetical protein
LFINVPNARAYFWMIAGVRLSATIPRTPDIETINVDNRSSSKLIISLAQKLNDKTVSLK